MSTPTRMDAMRVVDTLIQLIPTILAFVLFFASIIDLILGGLLNTTMISLPFVGVLSLSSITVLTYTSFYLYTFYNIDYLLPHIRMVVVVAIMMLGMNFAQLSFSTTIASATIHSCIIFIICVILWYYNRKNKFFLFPFSFVVLVIYFALMRIVLYKSPIANNFLMQKLMKVVAVWIWGDIYKKRGGLVNIKRGK